MTFTEAHWNTMKEIALDAAKFHASAEEALRNFVLAYLEQHPLSTEQKAALIDAFQAGRPLCCEKGRATLAEIVDPIWTESLNAWAYEVLSCSERDPVLRKFHLDLLKKRLDP